MTVSNANTNGVVGNGHAPSHAEVNHPASDATKPTDDKTLQNAILTFVLTIYDIVIFLGISIGYIVQVSISPFRLCPPLLGELIKIHNSSN